MKLSDILYILSGNTGINITLIDSNGSELITFNATGYKAVEEDIGKREVRRIKIDSATAVSIFIEDAVPEPTPEPNPNGSISTIGGI